ncbi:hypothetical protein QJQ45_014878, partial [Haematococcus lacustris]
TSLAMAKHDADSKLKEAETSLEQLKQQYQASQKKLIEQHLQYKRQAVTKVEELRRQSTTAQAHARRLAAEVEALQKASLRHVEEIEMLEERLSGSNAQEAAAAADLRLCKEVLAAAQSQVDQLNSSSISGSGSGPAADAEQRDCLDQLSVATEQLAAVLGQSDNLQYPAVQDMLKAATGSLEGTAALVSSWNRDSCAAALHHQVLNTALDIAQQQVDWYQHSAGAVLTSCPEAKCTKLHIITQQLQQAKSRTLFLVAQQQAPSHPATCKAFEYIKNIAQYMQEQLEQQLSLSGDKQACVAWQPQLVAVAAAMTRVNLLLASLQSSCPGLQLVSRLEEWGAQEGQQACEAPPVMLPYCVLPAPCSRPLFLVRPGLVCAAAGGGRQVLVRQQAVQLVPDPAWLTQQCQQADEELQAAEHLASQALRRQTEAAQRKEKAYQCLCRHSGQYEEGSSSTSSTSQPAGMTVVSDIGSQTTRMQRASAPAVQQAAPDSSSSATVHQASRTGLNGSAGGSQDEAPAACNGPTVSSVHEHRPSVSYARALTSGGSTAGSAQTNVSPKPQLPLGDSKPLLNDHAVPVVAVPNSAAAGDGATKVADENGQCQCQCSGPTQRTLPLAGEGEELLKAVQAATSVPVMTGSTSPPVDSNATAGSPVAAEQLVEGFGCDCKGVPYGQECNGKCGDAYPGSGFLRCVSGKRPCVDLEGKPLPQMVSKLHRMVRQLQADHSQQQERMRSQLQAAEQHATSIARAKHDADSKLMEAETSLLQLKQQYQASQKKLVEQHLQYKRQAVTEAKELRRQSTTAQYCSVTNVCSGLMHKHLPCLSQEELAAAQSQLVKLNSSSSSPGLGSGGGQGVLPEPLAAQAVQRCAGGSLPVCFSSVEQRECLDKLSVATEQLAAVLVQGNNLQYPLVQDTLDAAKGSLEGAANLVSSWDKDSCAAALHHRVLGAALDIAQQQVDWYADSCMRCLTSCPEAGRTELHAVLQQLQQSKSRTMFLVAQQQAPSHPGTREAVGYVEGIRQYMQGHLEQQLGLGSDKQASQVWQPELVAVAAAMTRVNLLLASLQSSCPGLQLVSRLENWVAQEGQQACEAPVRQLLGKVEARLASQLVMLPSCVLPAPCSRPLFLVRPGLVCAAAGGGRQVLVRQQAVALVPDTAWLTQQCQQADEELQAAEHLITQAHMRQREAAQRKEKAYQCLRRYAGQEGSSSSSCSSKTSSTSQPAVAPCSRPLFLVRPGLVCAAAGGGRQVLVRQQAVELVPDPAWLTQQCQQADEELQAAEHLAVQANRRQLEAAQRKEKAHQCLCRYSGRYEEGSSSSSSTSQPAGNP